MPCHSLCAQRKKISGLVYGETINPIISTRIHIVHIEVSIVGATPSPVYMQEAIRIIAVHNKGMAETAVSGSKRYRMAGIKPLLDFGKESCRTYCITYHIITIISEMARQAT